LDRTSGEMLSMLGLFLRVLQPDVERRVQIRLSFRLYILEQRHRTSELLSWESLEVAGKADSEPPHVAVNQPCQHRKIGTIIVS
jgi:hypothetical protein